MSVLQIGRDMVENTDISCFQ